MKTDINEVVYSLAGSEVGFTLGTKAMGDFEDETGIYFEDFQNMFVPKGKGKTPSVKKSLIATFISCTVNNYNFLHDDKTRLGKDDGYKILDLLMMEGLLEDYMKTMWFGPEFDTEKEAVEEAKKK